MSNKQSIIFCDLSDKTKKMIEDYAEALREAAPRIGLEIHNNQDQFWESGLFESAIERLRGQNAASTGNKQTFVEAIFSYMKEKGYITFFEFKGADGRHDYEVKIEDWTCAVELKGCLDGNNTTIFERPQGVNEFIIWSLCQNIGADPRHNAWSGIHTRLSAEIIHRKQVVDGVVIWDMRCNTTFRLCPKVAAPDRIKEVGAYKLPPPCIYLLPNAVPNPKGQPNPPVHQIDQVRFLHALYKCFGCNNKDVVRVSIEVKEEGSEVKRRTIYHRDGQEIAKSKWTIIRR
ncbi:MAG: hypothetical protein NZQ09_02290 [Chloroflexus sp.]|nr:hypothetical protein [Chloroflexus sp.]